MSTDGTIVVIGGQLSNTYETNRAVVRVYQYSNNSYSHFGSDIFGESNFDRSGHYQVMVQ